MDNELHTKTIVTYQEPAEIAQIFVSWTHPHVFGRQISEVWR